MAMLLKETKTYKTQTEIEATNLIEQMKEESRTEPYEVTKAGYVVKTKKSKGEIIDAWYIVNVEFTYDEE